MASSSDEGEIIDNGVEDLKASSLPRASTTHQGSGVDRRGRPQSKRSPTDRDAPSRYGGPSSRRSPSPRGHKRPHDDRERDREPYGRNRDYDSSRGSRPARYDDRPRENHQRSQVSYEDLDQPPSRSSYYDQDPRDRARGRDDHGRDRDRLRDDRDRNSNNRDRYSDSKRPRHRSRSPNQSRRPDRNRLDRFVKGDTQGSYNYGSSNGRGNSADTGLRYDDDNRRRSPGRDSVSSRSPRTDPSSQAPKDDAKPASGEAGRGRRSSVTWWDDYKPQPEPDWEEPQPVDEEAEIERRRKRRAEILSKSSSATPMLLQAVGASEKVRAASPAASTQPPTPRESSNMEVDSPRTPMSDATSPRSPRPNDMASPEVMDLRDSSNLMNKGGNKDDDQDGPSAADYDPTVDMKEDERRDELRHGQTVIHGEAHVVPTTEKEPAETAAPKPSTGGGDDDDDDDFDMFAEDFEEKFAAKQAPAADTVEESKGGILEGDDKDGYYKMRVGEVIGGRYQVQATLGRGMFSNVVRAVDTTTKKLVAIKMMRNNDALRKGGYTEITILKKLNDADPENRRHIIVFERSFDYRGHLCMAFENLSMNLREVLRKFGHNVGINLGATRTYAYQMFVALAHMRRCSVIHADLKPDNILVNDSRTSLKICDLGTAIDREDAATAHTGITPYLVSRFYRAPELMLGMPYDYGIDTWSIGCTLYELFTGKILFAGDSNNQMLKAIMEIRGRITPKLYKRGQLSAQHFDEAGQFISVEHDKVLGKTSVRTLQIVKPTRDLRTRLTAASRGLDEGESRDLQHFIDLLEHCLALNPDKRIKPADALKHPFFLAKRR